MRGGRERESSREVKGLIDFISQLDDIMGVEDGRRFKRLSAEVLEKKVDDFYPIDDQGITMAHTQGTE